MVSYNDEAWISPEQMTRALRDAGHRDVRLVAFDSRRYVGAQIGIFNARGERVGRVSHLRNTEYVFVAGPTERVEAAVASVGTISVPPQFSAHVPSEEALRTSTEGA